MKKAENIESVTQSQRWQSGFPSGNIDAITGRPTDMRYRMMKMGS